MVQIVELYTLHVLPRNDEWEYAHDFINMSEILDEERREDFLQALKSLEDEAKGTSPLQEMEPKQESEKLLQDAPIADNTSSDSTSTIREGQSSSRGLDYGIDAPKPTRTTTATTPETSSKAHPATATAIPARSTAPPKPIRKQTNTTTTHAPRPLQPMGSNAASRKPAPHHPPSFYKRSVTMLATLQHVIANMGQHLSRNPLALLRFVLFVMGLVAAFSRRDVKDRVMVGWEKVRRTVGMGVKVSYL